jgi:hypothetical protein
MHAWVSCGKSMEFRTKRPDVAIVLVVCGIPEVLGLALKAA